MRHLRQYESFRRLNENTSSIVDQIFQLDDELEKDPLYKEYEKTFTGEKFGPQIKGQVEMILRSRGVDPSLATSEEMEQLTSTILDIIMMEAEQAKGSVVKNEEALRKHKDNIIKMVDRIIELAEADQEFRLCAKLKSYNDLMKQL